jgi:hypothetical protein
VTTLEIDVGDLEARKVEVTKNELIVTLANGAQDRDSPCVVPTAQAAPPKQRANFEIMPTGIHWPDLDEDLSIAGMLKGQRG